jgi:hypothetical protein
MKLTKQPWAQLTRTLVCTSLFAATFFFSCQKESISTTNPSDNSAKTLTSENATTSIAASQVALLNAFKIFVEKAGEEGSLTTTNLLNVETRGGGNSPAKSQCTKITSSGWQRNVNSVTLDFGDGCMDIDGRKIAGQLHGRIQRSGRSNDITEIVLSPCNFMVDCSITTGEMILSNICETNGKYHFNWEVKHVLLSTFDKYTKKITGSCTMDSKGKALQSINGNSKSGHDDKHTEGRGNDDGLKTGGTTFADAIFDFTGDQYLFEVTSGKIVDPKHGTFGVKTQLGHPARVDINCAYPNKGIVEISPKAAWILPNFSVDFGNGQCDNEALVKVGGVLKHTIKMP